MQAITENLLTYLSTLDWAYMITFILIARIFNSCTVTKWITNGLGIRVRTRYRVLLIGGIYGIFVFFIRDYTLQESEVLLQSFVFAIVFHKFLLELLFEKIFPKQRSPENTNEIV